MHLPRHDGVRPGTCMVKQVPRGSVHRSPKGQGQPPCLSAWNSLPSDTTAPSVPTNRHPPAYSTAVAPAQAQPAPGLTSPSLDGGRPPQGPCEDTLQAAPTVIILSIRSGYLTPHPKSFLTDPASRINSKAWMAFKALWDVIGIPLSNVVLPPTHPGLMPSTAPFC